MPEQRKVRIDRAVYLADDYARTYRFLEGNPSWKGLSQSENKENKKSIDDYARIFQDGKSKVFRYRTT
jgi:hypothetical protein